MPYVFFLVMVLLLAASCSSATTYRTNLPNELCIGMSCITIIIHETVQGKGSTNVEDSTKAKGQTTP